MSEIMEIPNSWKAGVITNKGLGLLSKLITGNTLFITRAETGAGFVDPELLAQQTAVTDPMQALTFNAVSYPDEGKCMIPCKLTNAELETSYIARQIGLYAADPDEGEILFYITQVEDEDGGTGIPAANIIPSYSATWNLVIYYGMADGVNVTVDPAGAVTHEEMQVYVTEIFDASITQQEMEEYVEDYVETALGDSLSTTFRPATNEEIQAALDLYGNVSGGGSSGESTGTYTLDHSLLYNRDAADQHTIESITGLEEALAEAAASGGETMAEGEVEDVWDEVMGE